MTTGPNVSIPRAQHDAPLASGEHMSDKTEKETEILGKLEWFEGKLCEVVDASRTGWWRFHEHYDRDGYCDNPARGY